MATHTQVLLVDDLDGSAADDTVRFGLDGAAYEIDLNAEHAKALRAVVEPYADKARRTTANGKRPGRAGRTARTGQSGQLDPEQRREIRAWAQQSGQFGTVPERGRLAQPIIDAYHAAHA